MSNQRSAQVFTLSRVAVEMQEWAHALTRHGLTDQRTIQHAQARLREAQWWVTEALSGLSRETEDE